MKLLFLALALTVGLVFAGAGAWLIVAPIGVWGLLAASGVAA